MEFFEFHATVQCTAARTVTLILVSFFDISGDILTFQDPFSRGWGFILRFLCPHSKWVQNWKKIFCDFPILVSKIHNSCALKWHSCALKSHSSALKSHSCALKSHSSTLKSHSCALKWHSCAIKWMCADVFRSRLMKSVCLVSLYQLLWGDCNSH